MLGNGGEKRTFFKSVLVHDLNGFLFKMFMFQKLISGTKTVKQKPFPNTDYNVILNCNILKLINFKPSY